MHVPEIPGVPVGGSTDNPDKHDIPRESGTLAEVLSKARTPLEKAGNLNYPGHGPSTPEG